jgi:hypothetical protein
MNGDVIRFKQINLRWRVLVAISEPLRMEIKCRPKPEEI